MPRRSVRRGGSFLQDMADKLKETTSAVSGAIKESAEKIKGAVTSSLPITKPMVSDNSASQLGLAPENKGITMTGGRKRRGRKTTKHRKTTKRRS
jgi:hypothetical protein